MCLKAIFCLWGMPQALFFPEKKGISGFGGHAQFEEIALLLIFGHIWLQIEIAMSLFLRTSLK